MKTLLVLVGFWGCLGMVQCQKDSVKPDAKADSDLPQACTDSHAQPLIDELLRTPKANPAGEVWLYQWQGQPAFLVKSFRPDDFIKVYNLNNNQLRYAGAPSGGISGKGDGKCPTFAAEATGGCLLWRDPR